ncbi:AraC family transcriptional regulator [Flavitalea antarctica]
MKPLIQKLPLNAETSFIAKTFRTPHFEVSWHQHIELELILFTEGTGMSFIGNAVGEFNTGDIFFIGSNVPHTFQKHQGDQIASAVVVQFTDTFWGKQFLQIPETKQAVQLFDLSMKGLKIEGSVKKALGKLIQQLEHAEGFSRISTLCNCLQIILDNKNNVCLSSDHMNVLNTKSKERLDKIFQYTITNFQQPLSLQQIAQIANMSITAFCSYFKKSTKKSYIEFLNEVRVGYACKLLQDTDKPIRDICYECGYNTPENFNKQFLSIKKVTPRAFRNQFRLTVG